MQIESHDLIGLGATLIILAFTLWMKRSWNKALDSLETIPLLTRELREIAEYMKENKTQIAKIAVLESALQTAFKRIDELREDLKLVNEHLVMLRDRTHEHANYLAKVGGKLDLLAGKCDKIHSRG